METANTLGHDAQSRRAHPRFLCLAPLRGA